MQWADLLAGGVYLLTLGVVTGAKRSDAAHVYMGRSYNDVPSLTFVTGLYTQASQQILDPKTQGP